MRYTIYRITNQDTGRTYIGMTRRDIAIRFGDHRRALRRGTHINEWLQKDWDAGNRALTVTVVTTAPDHETAKKIETRLINLQDNAYNIAKGKPGSLVGYLRHAFRNNGRAYIYAEIEAQRGRPTRELRDKYGCSQPLVSMIWNGHRTAPTPLTSFADVFIDDDTCVQHIKPKRSRFINLYQGAQL